MALPNYYEDLDDQEFAEIAESWESSDFLSRYADLQDKKDLDNNPSTVV